jgi:AcrR family transcriptional regulator
MKKIDRRVLRTQQSLGNALVDLTLESGYDAITIKELTQRANIGYATFFRHFKSKDDLLMFVLQSVLEDIFALMKPDMTPYEQALVMFNYVKNNSRTYRVFIDLPRDSKLFNATYDAVATSLYENYIARDENYIPMEVAVNHIVTSITELIRWWVVNDMEFSPEKMATIQSELIIKATEIVAFKRISSSDRSAAD